MFTWLHTPFYKMFLSVLFFLFLSFSTHTHKSDIIELDFFQMVEVSAVQQTTNFKSRLQIKFTWL